MITCTNCSVPLYSTYDIFGSPSRPLCIDCHSEKIGDNGTDFYRNRSQVSQVQHDFAQDCPHCHYPMEIGLADNTVNAKCLICGYEETHALDNSLLDNDEYSWWQG